MTELQPDSALAKTTIRRFIVAVILGIGLAYIESAVVVYLRAIFYPDGFNFPLADFREDPQWRSLLKVELGRELATLVVLCSGAWLIGRNLRSRWAYFLTLFAVWDIFYYVWLKVCLNWPASLGDWDILFLIPTMWAGPVWAPVLISLVMLAMAAVILHRDVHQRPFKLALPHTIILVGIAVVIIALFCWTGVHVAETDYRSYFYVPLFLAAVLAAVGVFTHACLKR